MKKQRVIYYLFAIIQISAPLQLLENTTSS